MTSNDLSQNSKIASQNIKMARFIKPFVKRFKIKSFIWYAGVILLLLICFNSGLQRIINSDYFPTNGDFQNYNVWRRLLAGQIPFKEFPVYLGSGHLLLGSLFTFIFGNNFTASLFASYLLTSLFSVLSVYLTSFCIMGKKESALFITNIISIVNILRPQFIINIIPKDFWIGLDAMFYPHNSARIIRSAVIPIIVFSLIFIFYLYQKKENDEFLNNSKLRLIYITILAAFSGAGILYSNDYGISSYIALSLIFLLFLINVFEKDILSILKVTFYYIVVSACVFFILLALLTRGNVLSWFEFTLGVSSYQSWYYGQSINNKAYYLSQLNYSPIVLIALCIIFYNIYKLFNNKEKFYSLSLRSGGIIYILLSGIIATDLYRMMSGGFNNEFLYLCVFVILVSYLYILICNLFTKIFPRKSSDVIKFVVIIICFFLILPLILNKATALKGERNGEFNTQLGGYLTSYAPSLNTASKYLNGQPIFSTYASALETITGQFQPTGTDYIIHVLGDKARIKYLQDFSTSKYPYAQTIKGEFTPWEYWIRSANWFFYRELYKDYNISFDTIYSFIWERSSKSNTIQANASVKLEKISDSKFKLFCTADKKIQGIADVKLSYKSNFNKSFLKTGLVNKFVHVSDITAYTIYNEPYVNYFIPPNTDDYHIPITLVDGSGEVELDSYPNDATSLSITEVTVEEIIKNPFEKDNIYINHIRPASITDGNWINGVGMKVPILLFSNTDKNSEMLKGANQIKVGDKIIDIISIDSDARWIRANFPEDTDLNSFAYPNNIEVIPLEKNNINSNHIRAASITDDNWRNGVGIKVPILLFNNTRNNSEILKDAKQLKVGDKIIDVISIDTDAQWIHANFSEDTDLKTFAYPNDIEVIK